MLASIPSLSFRLSLMAWSLGTPAPRSVAGGFVQRPEKSTTIQFSFSFNVATVASSLRSASPYFPLDDPRFGAIFRQRNRRDKVDRCTKYTKPAPLQIRGLQRACGVPPQSIEQPHSA